MALLNLKEAEKLVSISLKSNVVPLLVGERGIGKTSIARQIADELNMNFISIEGTLLKEGEIGGLPTTQKVKRNSKEELVVVYAKHNILNTILEWHEQDPNKEILLFIDELNRAEFTVQQELLNLILNREVNGTKLPDTVKILCAINPTSEYEEFKDASYQVNDMDSALKDRVRHILVKADVETWLDWGSKDNRIDNDVLEFIANNSELLNQPNDTNPVTPSPRSWERVSNSLKYMKETMKENKDFLKTIQLLAEGDIGRTAAVAFRQFLANKENPLLKPEEILVPDNKEEVDNEIIERINKEGIFRKTVTLNNLLNYVDRLISKNEMPEYFYSKLRQVILQLSSEIKFSYQRKIKTDYPVLQELLFEDENYVNSIIEIKNNLF